MTIDDTAPPRKEGTGLSSYPPKETWDHVDALDAKAWPTRVRRAHRLVPTTAPPPRPTP